MKRALDVVLSLLALTLLSPLLLAISIAVAVVNGRPVLFKQKRAGYKGRIFEVIKFRTMTNAMGEDGELLPDDRRLTSLGKFLRASSLDELPELINVLRGDMSLVGPRPLLARYVDRYSDEQARRHEVRPGLTGWAQVNGRNAVDWDRRLEMDVWYVDHCNLYLDAKILVQTVSVLAKRTGISAEGHATMPEFLGSKKEGLA